LTKLSAETFAMAVRSHWGIENQLHWILAMVFHNGLARLRTVRGPRQHGKSRRKKTGWNQDYLEKVIRRTA
jgi:predicted transposase YbfD/YdcC